MAILPIVQYPAPVLAEIAKPVADITEEIRTLATDMAETMYDAPGVGLAAPQIGESIRMVTIDVSEEKNQLITMINPEIIATGAEKDIGEEGCLSLPGIYEKVNRYTEVTVRFQDLDGNTVEIEADGLLAVCIQHELDHLDGTLLSDVGLEVLPEFDSASEEEKEEVIKKYLESLDVKQK